MSKRLKLKFGSGVWEKSFQIDWPKTISEFPTVVTYAFRNWEFAIYQESKEPGIDWECIFTEIKTYDPRVTESHHPTLEDLLQNTSLPVGACNHHRATYTGLREVYDYCTLCNKRL